MSLRGAKVGKGSGLSGLSSGRERERMWELSQGWLLGLTRGLLPVLEAGKGQPNSLNHPAPRALPVLRALQLQGCCNPSEAFRVPTSPGICPFQELPPHLPTRGNRAVQHEGKQPRAPLHTPRTSLGELIGSSHRTGVQTASVVPQQDLNPGPAVPAALPLLQQ